MGGQQASVALCRTGGWFRNCRSENCYSSGPGQIMSFAQKSWLATCLDDSFGVEVCTFTNNYSASNGGCVRDIPIVRDCTFADNACAQQGGAVYFSKDGYDDYYKTNTPEVVNCTFAGNGAKSGGTLASEAANGTVADCTFSGNVAYGADGGGALYAKITNETASASLTVRNCLFDGNALTNATVQQKGSAATLLSNGANIMLESCTVVANSAAKGTPSAIYCADAKDTGIGQVYVTNTVVALNVGDDGASAPAISSADLFTGGLAARVGYSYLHPATGTDWWTDAQRVTDSDVAPKFKSGTWIPTSGSALRDAGLFQSWMTGAFDLQRDADGNAFATRLCGSAPDVGAFERLLAGGFTVIIR